MADQKWALAVEQCLGGLKFAWCVNDYNDAKMLEQIVCSVVPNNCKKPQILTSKFKEHVYDVTQFEAKTKKFPTVLKMLSVNDPVITNFLIDLRAIESVILISSNTEARRVMQFELPPNCYEAYTLSGDQVGRAVTAFIILHMLFII